MNFVSWPSFSRVMQIMAKQWLLLTELALFWGGAIRKVPWEVLPYITILVCATPRKRVIEPFWSENGYRLYPPVKAEEMHTSLKKSMFKCRAPLENAFILLTPHPYRMHWGGHLTTYVDFINQSIMSTKLPERSFKFRPYISWTQASYF